MNPKIDKLIIRYLEDQASSTDIKRLNEWLSEDDNNIRYFFRCKNLHDNCHPGIPPKNIDVQKALRKVMPDVNCRKIPNRYWYIAASIVLLLGIPALLFFSRQQVTDPFIPHSEHQPALISPGITLTLSNGQTIDLEEQDIHQITSSGNIVAEITDHSVKYPLHDSIPEELVYHTLNVPQGKTYSLILSDNTKMWVNAATQVSYPVQFAADKRQISVQGEIYLEVAHHPKAPFSIKMPQYEIIVLGTSFNVKSYPQEQQQITLVSGKVKIISGKNDHQTIVLSPGEQAILNDSDENIIIRKVNPDIYCSWHKGKMIFQNNSLEEILRILARHYDMDIVWTDKSLQKISFSGEMSAGNSIETQLKIIAHTGKVKFSVNGKQIMVEKNK